MQHRAPTFPLLFSFQEALQLFEEMGEAGVDAGLMTHNTVIAACVRAQNPEKAMEVFATIREKGLKPDQVGNLAPLECAKVYGLRICWCHAHWLILLWHFVSVCVRVEMWLPCAMGFVNRYI